MIGERSTIPMAYILINTEIGSESDVLEKLKKVEGVEEAHNLWGVYDIIASNKSRHDGQTKIYHKRENRKSQLQTDHDHY
jgi:hypothetical protein